MDNSVNIKLKSCSCGCLCHTRLKIMMLCQYSYIKVNQYCTSLQGNEPLLNILFRINYYVWQEKIMWWQII